MSDPSSLVALPFRLNPNLEPPLALLSALGVRLFAWELVVLLLRPRNPNRAYFSWPVPATGPFRGSLLGFSVAFSLLPLDFRDKKLNRGDLGGAGDDEGDWVMAGESLRNTFGPCDAVEPGVGNCATLLIVGEGEKAESTRGDPCFEEDLGENPKRLLKLVDVAEPFVSCDGVRLWYVA